MPVSTENSVSGPYTPNGVTTDFAFDFKATSADEVVALDQDGAVISSALYSVTLDDDEGGTLSFSVPPVLADYSAIFVAGNPALTQPSDFDNAGPSFNPAALTRALDRAAARDLKQQREIDRGLRVPFGEAGLSLPPVADRKGKYWLFDPVTGAASLDTPSNFAAPAAAEADRSEAEADRAATEKLGSESARDAAVAYLNPHASQAAGEAATSEGEPFSFLDGDDQVALAVRTAGGSELLPTYFGAAKVGVVGGGTAQNYFSSVAVPIDAFTGTTDQKLTAAVAALPSTGGVVQFGRGTYEFASQHTFAKAITLRGHGFSSTAAGTAPTQIVKDAAITGPLFIFSVDQSGLEDIGIKGESGNTGDGVAVRAGRFRARNVSVHSMGQDGIRFGQDATATNTNLMTLTNIHTNSNGRHGGYFHDGNPAIATAGANCNAGVINGWNATSNGGDGLKFEQSWWMTVSGAVVQVNTGAGINVVASGSSGSRYHTFIGGDQDESNTGGNIVNSGYRCSFVGVAPGTSFTDTGTDTNVVAREFTQFVKAKVTNILTSERPTAGPVDYTLIAKSYGNVSNGRGAGLEMQVPDGGTTARVGARVSARQETTNRDAVYFSVNNNGTVQDVVYASPNLTGFCPVTTNAFNLGHSTKEWNTIFLSSSGNGLRVNNVKVIGAQQPALPADATDLASAIALVNALKNGLKSSTGHGIFAG